MQKASATSSTERWVPGFSHQVIRDSRPPGKELAEHHDLLPGVGSEGGVVQGLLGEHSGKLLPENLLGFGVAGVQEEPGILLPARQEVLEHLLNGLAKGGRGCRCTASRR